MIRLRRLLGAAGLALLVTGGGDAAAATLACTAAPGEATGLTFLADAQTLTWSAPADGGGGAVVYDTLRSDVPWDFGVSAAVCVESNDGADTQAVASGVPPPGGVFHYLVRAETECGPGPTGTDSSGAARPPARPCGPCLHDLDCDDGVFCNGLETCDVLAMGCDAGVLPWCGPYQCDPVEDACFTTCTSEAQCASGYGCVGGICVNVSGIPCGTDFDCATGYCTDGVCCDQRCDATCEACNQGTQAGTCVPFPADTDPDDECATMPASSCGTTGTCDGISACQLYQAGTACGPAACSDFATSELPDECDGAGVCLDGGQASCEPYACDLATGACRTTCATPTHCTIGHECVAGICLKATGVPCGSDSECASGYCTDGVCCDSRCGGTCETCDQGAPAGTCVPFATGSDPDEECAATPVSSCGTTGACDGAGACELHEAGTVCAPAACSGSATADLPDTCDGAGACVDGGQASCEPYACNLATGACRATCATTTDCATGHDCAGGQCLKADGEACAADAECLHDACCDQVCRDPASDPSHCGDCGNVCQAQNGTNACLAGSCSPECNAGWGTCDGVPDNGCETSLQTLSNCGTCGVPCDLPNATESCTTGTCTLTGCDPGYSNCDGDAANGCEVDHAAPPNACGTAQDIGSRCGDAACGFFCPGESLGTFATRTGRTSKWFRGRASECSDCCAEIRVQVVLTPPSGTDYDLFMYSSCGTLLASSQNSGSAVDQLTIAKEDECFGADSGFDYWVEVRHWSGASCSSWTLVFRGSSALCS